MIPKAFFFSVLLPAFARVIFPAQTQGPATVAFSAALNARRQDAKIPPDDPC
jgi:hypothetical protein